VSFSAIVLWFWILKSLGIEVWLVFKLSPKGRKNVECINYTSDFPYDMVFSLDIWEGKH